MYKRLSISVCVVALFCPSLQAAVVTHFVGGTAPGQFPDVSFVLDNVGIGSGNVASETTVTSFSVPGPSGTNVNLTFRFERDTGSFLFSFGFFPLNAVGGMDPVTQKEAWATAAIGAATEVFDDRLVGPGATAAMNVSAGTELGFYLIPNNTQANFLGDPGAFYPPITIPGTLRAPLFSNSHANPGELDQMLSFIANGVTLFTFEDLARVGFSDQDFTDLAFTVDTELIPSPPPRIPEPAAFLVWSGFSLVGIGAARWRRRAKPLKPRSNGS